MTRLDIYMETTALRKRLEALAGTDPAWVARTEGQLDRLDMMGNTLTDHFCREALDWIGREITEREDSHG